MQQWQASIMAAKHKFEPVSKGSASKKTSQGDQEMGDETSAVPSYRESFNSSLILSPELATRGRDHSALQ